MMAGKESAIILAHGTVRIAARHWCHPVSAEPPIHHENVHRTLALTRWPARFVKRETRVKQGINSA